MKKKKIDEQCMLCHFDKAHFLLPHLGNSIIKCINCGLISTYPKLPEKEELKKYVEKEYFLERQESYQYSREEIFSQVLNLIEPYKKDKGVLLDIGCNVGYFLKKVKERGWKTFGVEPSKAVCQIAKERFNLDVFNGVLREAKFPNEHFDVITFLTVLDQISIPLKELKEVYRILKPGGVILVRVPNVIFHLGLFYFQNLFPPFFKTLSIKEPMVFHLYAFSRRTIKKLFRLAGFKDIEFFNAKPSLEDIYGALNPFNPRLVTHFKKIWFTISQLIFYISDKHFILNSSLLVIAKKK